MTHFDRRKFLQTVTAGVALTGLSRWTSSCQPVIQNKLPRWRGFNILDFFSPRPYNSRRFADTEQDFQWMADWGFDFVRFPNKTSNGWRIGDSTLYVSRWLTPDT